MYWFLPCAHKKIQSISRCSMFLQPQKVAFSFFVSINISEEAMAQYCQYGFIFFVWPFSFVCFGSAQYFWLCFCYYLYQILSSAFFYRKKLNFAIKHISFHNHNSRKKVCFCHRKLCFSWQGDPLSTWKNHKWNRRQEFIWIFLSPLRIPACMSFTGYQSTAEIYITFF